MNKNHAFIGILLVLLGIYFMLLNSDFLGHQVQGVLGSAIPLLVGVAFLVTFFSGQQWAIVPGSIVSCVGLVVVLASTGAVDMSVWWPVFVLAPGLGFWLIRLFGGAENRWALAPALIISLVSMVMFSFTLGVFSYKWFTYIDDFWPIVLILIGIKLLLVGRKNRSI